MDIYNVGDQGRKAIEGTNNNFKLSSYFCHFYGGKSQNISSTRESCNKLLHAFYCAVQFNALTL